MTRYLSTSLFIFPPLPPSLFPPPPLSPSQVLITGWQGGHTSQRSSSHHRGHPSPDRAAVCCRGLPASLHAGPRGAREGWTIQVKPSPQASPHVLYAIMVMQYLLLQSQHHTWILCQRLMHVHMPASYARTCTYMYLISMLLWTCFF